MTLIICGRAIGRAALTCAGNSSIACVRRLSRRPRLMKASGRSRDSRATSRAGDAGTGAVGAKPLNSLFQPVPQTPLGLDGEDIHDVGTELVGPLEKGDVLRVLNEFYRKPEIQRLGQENGLDTDLFHQAYVSFRRFCIESKVLPVELHVILSDIINKSKSAHISDIFPYFMQHAKDVFPHLDCMDDLKKISDLRTPANWYPEARAIQRKIVFHAGPTNSGKTYHALERFTSAKSGVYCGPLRMLASEVFKKTNELGTMCDLVTGEDRRYADENENPSAHVACTVEMTSVSTPYEVAVIDEIQMMRDQQRGWAWTRAFLGVCAQEVHVCGEASAIEMIRQLSYHTGDEVEIRNYKRLTDLRQLDYAVENFKHMRKGDCIVCFSKNDIYYVSRQLEKLGRECAVIYGSLPPGTKLSQAAKFNDPEDSCKVMVATDAIGMGLNLNIKRIVFYSLMKPTLKESGDREIETISPAMALQIAGRAGRYGTQFEKGEVTTYRREDMRPLNQLLMSDIKPVMKAGLHPTAEQIELFAYYLPNATLSNLIDIFVTLSKLDADKYFMCNVDDFKFLADMVEHVPLSLRARYVFCCAPISKKSPFVCTMFLKFARRFSRGEAVTLDWLCKQLAWPYKPAKVISDLVQLEATFDVLDLYLWLSYRFQDVFPDTEHVQYMQKELDAIISSGVKHITKLLKNSETRVSGATAEEDDEFEAKIRLKRTLSEGLDIEEEDEENSSTAFDKRLRELQGGTNENTESVAKGEIPTQPVVNQKRSLLELFKGAKSKQQQAKESGQLSDQLIKQGLLTKDMLAKLQQEWLSGQADLSKKKS